jgi:5-(carboxyamino)imidazole ribonucleotide synthase
MNPFNQRIGLIGGGQLGRMLILAAKQMGFTVTVLDPAPNCPAQSLADAHIAADFYDAGAIKALGAASDVVTFEIEHIDTQALAALPAAYPLAATLARVQNKLAQKQTLRAKGLPVPDFLEISGPGDIQQAGAALGWPFFLKAAKGGYDGRGNFLVGKESDAASLDVTGGKFFAEQYVPFEKEISVLLCRGLDGSAVTYPVAENRHKDSILIETRAPAEISPTTRAQALEIALEAARAFEAVGMFCVELFVTPKGLLVNELAPRPHNSGHYTLEACPVSQFAQHIRAITGLPLAGAGPWAPAVMRNLLGEGTGTPRVVGAEAALALEGLALHLYGKRECRPLRKMGHYTVVARTLAEAAATAEAAAKVLRVVGG